MNVNNRPAGHSDILAIGFGTTVAMWGLAYICRLPLIMAPSWVVGVVMIFCLFAGGTLAGRYSPRGTAAGLLAGLLASALNLLVLGSLVSSDRPNEFAPSALLWLPGSLVAGAVLGWVGAMAGKGSFSEERTAPNWSGIFATVVGCATFFLLIAGGLVTSAEAGLAVVDWPNSFGYNMFLYPLSRMTGGIFYEHAHRLLGSLVGLSTLVFVIHLYLINERPWVRNFAQTALLLVIVQGILGGLRVTGKFTLTTSPEEVAPSIALAIVHGVFGQITFGAIVALAALTSRTWKSDLAPTPHPSAPVDRVWNLLLVLVLVIQLVLGALQRHIAQGLIIHITMAAVVFGAAVTAGIRAWGIHANQVILSRAGIALLGLVTFQIALGFGALVVTGGRFDPESVPTIAELTVTTAHQAVGAALLALSVLLMLWNYRLLVQPEPE